MKKIILGLFTCLGFSMANAQVTVNAELKSIINQSFQYFSTIKEVENGVKTAEEKMQLTSLSKTPDINFNSGYNFIMPKISFPINGNEVQFAPVHNVNAAIGSAYTILDWGRLKANITKAKTDIQLANDQVDLAKCQLANQVAVIYYNIIFYRKAIAIQDSVIRFYMENKKLVENRLKSGDMIKLDVLNLEASIGLEENKKIDLLNLLNKQLNLLAYTAGVNNILQNQFDFSTAFSSPSDLSTAQTFNPVFFIQKDKNKLAQQELDIIKLGNKPKINLNASAGFRNGFVTEVNTLRFNYLAGVSIAVPLYGFGKINQQVKWQQTFIKQLALAEISLNEAYKKDLQQNELDIQSNKDRIENIKGQVLATKTAQDLTSTRYQNGVATYLDLIAAATNVQKIALTQLQYEYQLCIAKIESVKLLGIHYWNN